MLHSVHWGGDEFTLEADPRLIEKLINMLNLSGGKGAWTLDGKDIGRDVRDSDCELEHSEAKLLQTAAGLEQYIALDRSDIAYSVKTALQQMAKPTNLMQLRVVRVGRYLKNNPRFAEYYGRAPIAFASSTQSVQALSTGEAEFCAITGVSAHSLHSQAVLKGFGCDGGSSCLVGRECWHWDRIAPRLWTTGSGERLGEGISTSQASTETPTR